MNNALNKNEHVLLIISWNQKAWRTRRFPSEKLFSFIIKSAILSPPSLVVAHASFTASLLVGFRLSSLPCITTSSEPKFSWRAKIVPSSRSHVAEPPPRARCSTLGPLLSDPTLPKPLLTAHSWGTACAFSETPPNHRVGKWKERQLVF